MIRFKCNGEPYIDPLYKFTIADWERGEKATSIAEVVTEDMNPEPMTLETMMAAIDKLKDLDYSNNISCFGDYKVQECAWMKGMEVVVIYGDKAYCWPNGIVGKEVKVIRIPEPPKPELSFKWEFDSSTINWE